MSIVVSGIGWGLSSSFGYGIAWVPTHVRWHYALGWRDNRPYPLHQIVVASFVSLGTVIRNW
mgnify:CR=1 FL=1